MTGQRLDKVWTGTKVQIMSWVYPVQYFSVLFWTESGQTPDLNVPYKSKLQGSGHTFYRPNIFPPQLERCFDRLHTFLGQALERLWTDIGQVWIYYPIVGPTALWHLAPIIFPRITYLFLSQRPQQQSRATKQKSFSLSFSNTLIYHWRGALTSLPVVDLQPFLRQSDAMQSTVMSDYLQQSEYVYFRKTG